MIQKNHLKKMSENFNYLEIRITNPWTNEQNDLIEINFQVINELEINNITIFENKDDKIDSSIQLEFNSNYLNKKRYREKKGMLKIKEI